MPDATTQKVLAAIAKVKNAPAETLDPAADLASLGLDSLDMVTLAFELEDAFHVTIPDEKIRSVRSVSDIVAGIRALESSQPGASAAGG